jgi:hypothetical protein
MGTSSAVDATHSWATGNGIVISTSDGGSTWTSRDVPQTSATPVTSSSSRPPWAGL